MPPVLLNEKNHLGPDFQMSTTVTQADKEKFANIFHRYYMCHNRLEFILFNVFGHPTLLIVKSKLFLLELRKKN
jgi:hypothetical protein